MSAKLACASMSARAWRRSPDTVCETGPLFFVLCVLHRTKVKLSESAEEWEGQPGLEREGQGEGGTALYGLCV